MIGLMFIVLFVVYLLISFAVVNAVIEKAKKNKRSALGWGLLASFVMYNLVFWDWIPSLALHHDYCSTEARRAIYISPELWLEQQNLNGTELMLGKAERRSSRSNNSSIYPMNSRVNYVITKEVRWPKILRFETKYIDVKTNAVLAKSVDFESGGCSRNNSIMDYRFWMNRCGCDVPTKSTREEFKNLEKAYDRMGRPPL
jgi:hypothetical protein